MEDTPVYVVTGFLESGKTKFVQETLQDKKFCDGDRILVISFEEGEEELDPSLFASKDIFYEFIEDKEEMSPEKFIILQKKHNATKILVEYNGMWQLSDLYDAAPENWVIGQQILFFDATTFMNYNANMRSLVVDKIQPADMIVFNRLTEGMDPMDFHRVVRGLSRSAAIIYEKTTGEIAYDTIEDPLPFDKDAEVIEIEDKDYALFYRDLCENMSDYDGKTVKFTALICNDKALGTGTMLAGRHVMTCCVEDIQYSPMVCKWGRSDDWENYDWAAVTGKIKIANHKVYGGKGPILYAQSVEKAEEPEVPVAVFY
ncbi:MAG: GTP-binding protein [Clostridia bacterium]|nr:GTP-binding protein [Clostridia bacterium]